VSGRSRTPHSGATGDESSLASRHGSDDGGGFTPTIKAGNVAQAHQTLSGITRAGRPTVDSGGLSTPAHPSHPDDITLRGMVDVHTRLGDEPPTFEIAHNDQINVINGAHTIDRHGPDIPLPRDRSTKTIEGRIYGDTGWNRPESWSYRWTDPSTMNRTVREYVQANWEAIRSDLAMFEAHEGVFDTGHRVGEGYFNSGMYGAGPRAAQYAETSYVKIRIKLVPGADPPEPFIVTAFPTGLL
jgi:hypothetical protein